MKTTIVFKAFTALAAVAAAICAYSTMPEGRALTDQEKFTGWGQQITGGRRYSCAKCTPDGGQNCSPYVNPPANPSAGSMYCTCSGSNGQGVDGPVILDAFVTTKKCEPQCFKTVKRNGKWIWVTDEASPLAETKDCGSISACDEGGAANPDVCRKKINE